MIRLDIEPTPEVVKKLIDKHDTERYEMLQRYYEGKNDEIRNRVKKDLSKPNNKIINGYPSYIIDVIQGYFIGKPVTYSSMDEELMKELQDIFNYNDEQDENSELAKMAGIKGKAYEIVYIDEDAYLRFNEMDADNIIMVHDTKINPDVNFAIRYYKSKNLITNRDELYAEVYTKENIQYYKEENNNLVLQDIEEHYFGQVPVIEFLNNDEAIGDFERVISLIDAYDKAQSDTANDFEEFTDAFLCLVNMSATDDEDIKKLKEDKVLLIDKEGQAYWLIKEINDSAVENYKDRLKNDIHKFSKTPDMSDVNFSSNASGVAMAYKLLALEQVMATKERKFKRALQRRLELIVTYLNFKGGNYDWRDVDITFARNKPINVKEEVETAQMLRGFTSNSTALSQLPMIDDVSMELEKIESEKDPYHEDLDSIDIDNEDNIYNNSSEMMKILNFIAKLPEKDRDIAKDILAGEKQ